jgi:hypothetical protein
VEEVFATGDAVLVTVSLEVAFKAVLSSEARCCGPDRVYSPAIRTTSLSPDDTADWGSSSDIIAIKSALLP